MLAAACFQSRHAGDALTYICLDAPLRGTHDVAALYCSSWGGLVPSVRIWSSLSERQLERERRVTRPVAGLSIAGEERVCWRGVVALLTKLVRSGTLRVCIVCRAGLLCRVWSQYAAAKEVSRATDVSSSRAPEVTLAGGFGKPPPEHVTVQETCSTHGADMASLQGRLATLETIPIAA
jgi:hypothetical protein